MTNVEPDARAWLVLEEGDRGAAQSGRVDWKKPTLPVAWRAHPAGSVRRRIGALTLAVALRLSHCGCLTLAVALRLSHCGCRIAAVALRLLTTGTRFSKFGADLGDGVRR